MVCQGKLPLQHQEPMWALVGVPAASLMIQLPADAPWKASERGPSTWDSIQEMWMEIQAPGFGLATVNIWRVNQWAFFCPSL